MSKETARNLFMVSSMPRLYQALLTGVGSYVALGNRIVRQIKVAHAFRQSDTVKELSGILINIPIKEYQLIGQYYLVWCKCRISEYDSKALERIIDQTHTFKSKALISRAAFEGYQMNLEREFYFYTEALNAQPTISERIDILKSLAVVKAKEGFHQSALKELEAIMPIVRHTEPIVCFDVLNSYAVELGEVGRKDEARNIMRHVLASPFAPVYPEWQQTAADLQGGSRSMVQVVGSRADSPSPDNVLSMTLAPERVVESPPLRPGKVLDYVRYKNKMAKKKAEIDENIDKMDRKDLVVKMLELISPENVDEEKLRSLVKHAVEVMTNQK